MTPSPSYKDYKGESLRLSAAGRKNDNEPVGILQISNITLFYNEKKFSLDRSESASQKITEKD